MHLLYRCYHFVLKSIVRFIGIPEPQLYQGTQGLKDAIADLSLPDDAQVLVVTDKVLNERGIIQPVLTALYAQNLSPVVYDQVQPNPTIKNIEQGYQVYNQHHCVAIVSVGGGSVLDAAKLIGARVVRPKRPVKTFSGLFKVLKTLPPNIAIPTTAGTGSETTVAAVFNDEKQGKKLAAADFCLVPQRAVLLSQLTTSLPGGITATTAIDALTHAIEAILSINATKLTNDRALEACSQIFAHLPTAYHNGQDQKAREKLLYASFLAGQAFTRTSVGYIHAISHQLTARYGTPHGLANAVLLLPVLHWYGSRIHRQLAMIACHCSLTSLDYPVEQQAQDLIAHITQLLAQLNIQTQLTEVLSDDIQSLAVMALDEAHPDYPVPHFMALPDCQNILTQIRACSS
ncbi:iron-containing alcohol dehydrogenase [Pseudoalteromonas sp. DL2-H2.2]|uniref:iron-containing alcohol dehydrogenase n=1 Tax=Pseudoalteromonas sp. DL2-H2.2 TaxID=2908889 RepID=UPI001F490CF3|nr:iron-containing alcohol dehydrogenase [Pseudoalteromonas sp. DL2-H2.2]MCF2907296.1 iron-containing alcohol dehydrogenase [Pseudoalteromonas sp. DL2-H2.2]